MVHAIIGRDLISAANNSIQDMKTFKLELEVIMTLVMTGGANASVMVKGIIGYVNSTPLKQINKDVRVFGEKYGISAKEMRNAFVNAQIPITSETRVLENAIGKLCTKEKTNKQLAEIIESGKEEVAKKDEQIAIMGREIAVLNFELSISNTKAGLGEGIAQLATQRAEIAEETAESVRRNYKDLSFKMTQLLAKQERIDAEKAELEAQKARKEAERATLRTKQWNQFKASMKVIGLAAGGVTGLALAGGTIGGVVILAPYLTIPTAVAAGSIAGGTVGGIGVFSECVSVAKKNAREISDQLRGIDINTNEYKEARAKEKEDAWKCEIDNVMQRYGLDSREEAEQFIFLERRSEYARNHDRTVREIRGMH